MADTQWLEKRRLRWYAVLDVPAKARPALGKSRLVQSLKTDSLSTARLRRHAVLAGFHKLIDNAGKAPVADALQEEALSWREELARLETLPPGSGRVVEIRDGATGERVEVEETQAETMRLVAMDRAEEIAKEQAPRLGQQKAEALAGSWYEVATGRATPLEHHVDAWLAEGGRKGPVIPATQRAYRRFLAALKAWCGQQGIPATIESINGRTASDFAAHLLLTKQERSTANNTLHALSAYWAWLLKRHHVPPTLGNPWHGQLLSIPQQREAGGDERPFTLEELARLLGGGADPTLLDGMTVAALSGLRVEEMHQLRLRDCTGGAFTVTKGKSKAALRSVPIHSDLVPIVARLSEGKGPADFLFPTSAKGWRADAMTSRFLTYRRRLEIDDRSAGRRSLVNWHSFRRWFATAAGDAGQPLEIIGACLGHAPVNVTDRRYMGKGIDRLRECVEAVKLPAPVVRLLPLN